MGNHYGSRKAAAEEEHMLIRGSKGGSYIVREVINNMQGKEQWDFYSNQDLERNFEHHQDPPLNPKIYICGYPYGP